jgi:hypothetical protein
MVERSYLNEPTESTQAHYVSIPLADFEALHLEVAKLRMLVDELIRRLNRMDQSGG